MGNIIKNLLNDKKEHRNVARVEVSEINTRSRHLHVYL